MANRNRKNPGNQPNQTGNQSGNPRNQALQRGEKLGLHPGQSSRTSSVSNEKLKTGTSEQIERERGSSHGRKR